MSRKTIITTIISLLLITLFVIIILCYPLVTIPDFIENSKNEGVITIEKNEPVSQYKEGTSFDSFNEKFYSDYQFITTDWNPLNPTITIVYESRHKPSGISFEIYTLNRTGILEYQIYSRRFGYTRDYTYEQMIEFTKKQNIAENNPDPDKIVIIQQELGEE